MGPIPEIAYDNSQQTAIEAACQNGRRNIIITGSAGTGKTTLIKEIAERLKYVTLLAPTGKAAARLKDATGFDAATIHRELKWDGTILHRTGPFDNPVIVDEASMCDSRLLRQLLDFNPPKLILVGDPAQLPPVGHGQPFHDIIKLRPEIVYELTHCWRAQGAVHKAAQAIRFGKPPAKQDVSGGESWTMHRTGGAEPTTRKIIEWVEGGHFDSKQDIMLSPRYGKEENDGGIDAINKAIKDIVNPSDKKISVDDRVIITKNDSKNDNWNGDLATVVDINIAGQLEIVLDRKGEQKLLTKEGMRNIDLAYCLSIHKSQGSQWRRVFLVVLKKHWYQLDRSLIYTGITRAQKGVCVCGELEAFYHGINHVKQKTTVLQYLGKKVA